MSMKNNEKTSFAYNGLNYKAKEVFYCEKRKSHISMFYYFSICIFCEY